jgi:hypothetical protein
VEDICDMSVLYALRLPCFMGTNLADRSESSDARDATPEKYRIEDEPETPVSGKSPRQSREIS